MEEKEVVDVEITKETERKGVFDCLGNKLSLIAFILMDVGIDLAVTYYLSVIGLGMCIAALCLINSEEKPDRNPFKVFNRITKIVSIIGIVLGGIMSLVLFITIMVIV